MNYKHIYDNIITNANQRQLTGYIERHHITPKSLGGANDISNLVDLTAREHFICHALLAKIYDHGSFEWYKTNHAFLMMKCSSKTHTRYFNSRLYELLRHNFSEVMSKSQSGENNSQYGTKWIFNPVERVNKKINNDDIIPDGWYAGSRFNWNIPNYNRPNQDLLCPICKSKFVSTGYEKVCSSECKQKLSTINSPTTKYKPLLDEIALTCDITYGSVSRNVEFITSAIDRKIPKNQILWYLGCNNAGANYKTIKTILKNLPEPISV